MVPVSFVLAGVLFVASAVSSEGTDLRAGGYQDLPGLISAQSSQVEQRRQEAADLREEITALSDRLARNRPVKAAQQRYEKIRAPAGLEPVVGSGITVTLSDAPADVQAAAAEDENVNINDTIVHQQDIQAVANAMWAGGATAMTIQGQRVVSTTGIKCVGNTVILQNVPYAPPYVLTAVGPTDQLLDSLTGNNYIQAYLSAVSAYDLGWQVDVEPSVKLPAYDGPTEMRYARPITSTTVGTQPS